MIGLAYLHKSFVSMSLMLRSMGVDLNLGLGASAGAM